MNGSKRYSFYKTNFMEYFNKTFCLEVWGDYACFTRPEMKVERVSYDVITPSATRAIFEAIFWKPAIRYKITRIEVLKKIRWISVRRNEIAALMSERVPHIFIEDKGKRQQKAGLFLRDVAYRLYAELEFIPVSKRPPLKTTISHSLPDESEQILLTEIEYHGEPIGEENPGKYNAMFERRAKKGQCFNQPYLGCREFTANFRLIENPEIETCKPITEDKEFGFMLYDMDFTQEKPSPMFFRASMKQGVILVPPVESKEVRK